MNVDICYLDIEKFECDNYIIQSLNHIGYLISGCKSKRKIRKLLDILKIMINPRSMFYVDKEM